MAPSWPQNNVLGSLMAPKFVLEWFAKPAARLITEIMRKFDLLFERGLTQKQLAVSHAALTAQMKLLHLN